MALNFVLTRSAFSGSLPKTTEIPRFSLLLYSIYEHFLSGAGSAQSKSASSVSSGGSINLSIELIASNEVNLCEIPPCMARYSPLTQAEMGSTSNVSMYISYVL